MMKRILLSILLLFTLATPSWAIVTYNCDYLTGGAQRALDYISISDLNNGDHAHVYTSGEGLLFFKYVASGTTTENTSAHPYYVRPNDYVTNGVWEEMLPSAGYAPIPGESLSAGMTTYNVRSVPILITGKEPLSGTSLSVACPVKVVSGASLYRSGATATVYFYGPVDAGDHAWIDESSVSAYFMPGSVKEINPMWWGADGYDTIDDTIAIRAAGRSSYPASTTVSGWYIYSYPEIVIPAGHYYISSGVTIGSASASIRGSDHAIIEQTTPTEDILVWGYGYNVDVSNLTFIGGRRQIAYSNPNLGPVEIRLNNVKFTHNNSDAALKFYVTAGSAQLSGTATLNGCMFKDTYQCAETVLGLSFRFNDGWVYTGGVTNTNRALFVNRADMALTGMYGVPNAIVTPTGGRWIDNYSDLMIDRCRFGSEGSGMPIVYNYDVIVPRASGVGGGKVSIRNSALSCGDTTVDNTIIRLMTGIPQNITIRDNDWIFKSASTPFIVADPSFDAAYYINSLGAFDFCFIDAGNNASYIPLEMAGISDVLFNTDKNKIRFSRDFEPHVGGYTRKSLLHFDGATSGTTVYDEFFNAWYLSGASTYGTSKRFGNGSLYLNGVSGVAYSTNFLSAASPFTMEAWFLSGNSTTANQTIFHAKNAGGYGAHLYYNNGGDRTFRLKLSGNGTSWDIGNGAGLSYGVPHNTWCKIALEFTGSEYAVYYGLPGSGVTKEITVTSGTTIAPITGIYLGGNSGYMVGGMDEFRLKIGDYRYGASFIPEKEAFKVD